MTLSSSERRLVVSKRFNNWWQVCRLIYPQQCLSFCMCLLMGSVFYRKFSVGRDIFQRFTLKTINLSKPGIFTSLRQIIISC